MFPQNFIRGFSFAVLIFGITGAVRIASAQETINNGSISGRVTDATGAVVQDALVTARQTETNLTGTIRTDHEGRFRFPYLRLGPYEVTVHQQGFVDATRSIILTVGSAFEIPFSLTVASAQASITVNAEAAVLENARTQIAGTVPQAEVSSLPLNGRNFLDVALLIPGVSPTNTAANQLFADISGPRSEFPWAASGMEFSNSFIVDGSFQQRRCRGSDRRVLRA